MAVVAAAAVLLLLLLLLLLRLSRSRYIAVFYNQIGGFSCLAVACSVATVAVVATAAAPVEPWWRGDDDSDDT